MPAQCDVYGHLNVRHYAAFFDDAGWHMLGRIGVLLKDLHAQGLGSVVATLTRLPTTSMSRQKSVASGVSPRQRERKKPAVLTGRRGAGASSGSRGVASMAAVRAFHGWMESFRRRESGTRPAFGLAKGQTRGRRGSAKVDVAHRPSRSPKDLARIHPAQGFPLADVVRRAIDPLDQLLVRLTVRRLARCATSGPRRLPGGSPRHRRNRTVSIQP